MFQREWHIMTCSLLCFGSHPAIVVWKDYMENDKYMTGRPLLACSHCLTENIFLLCLRRWLIMSFLFVQ